MYSVGGPCYRIAVNVFSGEMMKQLKKALRRNMAQVVERHSGLLTMRQYRAMIMQLMKRARETLGKTPNLAHKYICAAAYAKLALYLASRQINILTLELVHVVVILDMDSPYGVYVKVTFKVSKQVRQRSLFAQPPAPFAYPAVPPILQHMEGDEVIEIIVYPLQGDVNMCAAGALASLVMAGGQDLVDALKAGCVYFEGEGVVHRGELLESDDEDSASEDGEDDEGAQPTADAAAAAAGAVASAQKGGGRLGSRGGAVIFDVNKAVTDMVEMTARGALGGGGDGGGGGGAAAAAGSSLLGARARGLMEVDDVFGGGARVAPLSGGGGGARAGGGGGSGARAAPLRGEDGGGGSESDPRHVYLIPNYSRGGSKPNYFSSCDTMTPLLREALEDLYGDNFGVDGHTPRHMFCGLARAKGLPESWQRVYGGWGGGHRGAQESAADAHTRHSTVMTGTYAHYTNKDRDDAARGMVGLAPREPPPSNLTPAPYQLLRSISWEEHLPACGTMRLLEWVRMQLFVMFGTESPRLEAPLTERLAYLVDSFLDAEAPTAQPGGFAGFVAQMAPRRDGLAAASAAACAMAAALPAADLVGRGAGGALLHPLAAVLRAPAAAAPAAVFAAAVPLAAFGAAGAATALCTQGIGASFRLSRAHSFNASIAGSIACYVAAARGLAGVRLYVLWAAITLLVLFWPLIAKRAWLCEFFYHPLTRAAQAHSNSSSPPFTLRFLSRPQTCSRASPPWTAPGYQLFQKSPRRSFRLCWAAGAARRRWAAAAAAAARWRRLRPQRSCSCRACTSCKGVATPGARSAGRPSSRSWRAACTRAP